MDAEAIANKGLQAAGEKKAHLWDRHPRDWYVEPEWCSDRLFTLELIPKRMTVWDPAAGMGRILNAAYRAGYNVHGSDIEPRGDGVHKWDFFHTPVNAAPPDTAIVSNPPFGKAEAFVAHALACSRLTIMLLPSSWIQGERRVQWLLTTPLQEVLFICPRPSMPPGELVLAGEKPGNGSRDYAWFVWNADRHPGPAVIGWCVR